MFRRRAGLERRVGQLGPDVRQLLGFDVAVGQTPGHGLAPGQRESGQRQVFADTARAAAQEVATADVREQADAGFRHGHARALGHQAQTGALGNAHAAAHHDAIQHHQQRLGVGVDQVVELVLLGEEVLQRRVAGQCRLVEETDVAAGAKGTKRGISAHAAYRHRQHLRVVAPGQQAGGQGAQHVQAERVQCLWPVQADQAHASLLGQHHLICAILHSSVSRPSLHSPAARRSPARHRPAPGRPGLPRHPPRPAECRRSLPAGPAWQFPVP